MVTKARKKTTTHQEAVSPADLTKATVEEKKAFWNNFLDAAPNPSASRPEFREEGADFLIKLLSSTMRGSLQREPSSLSDLVSYLRSLVKASVFLQAVAEGKELAAPGVDVSVIPEKEKRRFWDFTESLYASERKRRRKYDEHQANVTISLLARFVSKFVEFTNLSELMELLESIYGALRPLPKELDFRPQVETCDRVLNRLPPEERPLVLEAMERRFVDDLVTVYARLFALFAPADKRCRLVPSVRDKGWFACGRRCQWGGG